MRTGKARPEPSAASHVVVPVHVQPRASRTEVAGMHGDAVKIRLTAPPVDGAANEELMRFVAARLGVPRSDVDIVAGATSRSKRVRVHTTLSASDVLRRLCAGGKPRQ